MSERRKLGEILRNEGLIDEFQLEAALAEQARWGNRVGETLVRMGFLSEMDLVRTLSARFGVPGVNLRGKTIEPHVLDLVPGEIAEKYGCLPLFTKRQGGVEVLYLGMDDPSNLTAIDDVSFRTGLGVRPVMVGPLQLRDGIASSYRGESPPEREALEIERAIPEAPLVQEDTAPVMPDGAGFFDDDPTGEPLATEAPDAGAPAPAPAEEAKPRDVPTRQILRAVTHLLIEKGVLTRRELMERVRAIQDAEPGADDA